MLTLKPWFSNILVFGSIYTFFFSVLRIEPRALRMLDKGSTTEVYLPALHPFTFLKITENPKQVFFFHMDIPIQVNYITGNFKNIYSLIDLKIANKPIC